MRLQHTARRHHAGAAAVEFALVVSVFLVALMGAIEFARLAWLWNTAVESTRKGARAAVVCDLADTAISDRVREWLPMLDAADVSVTYLPAGCNAATCSTVTVQVAATTPLQTFIPFVPLSLTLPAAKTTLTRESMASTLPGASGGNNPICQ